MKEYEEAIEKDNKIKRNLSWGLITVIGFMVVLNISAGNVASSIVTSIMFVIIILVHFLLEKEANRKLANLKKMFRKN